MKDMRNLFLVVFFLGMVLLGLQPSPAAAADRSPAKPLPASWTADPEITARLASDPALFSKSLDEAMRKLLSNPASLVIELEPIDPVESSLGHFNRVTVKVTRGETEGLVLDKADTEIFDVQINTTKLIRETKVETVKVREINMDVSILEPDLNGFLEAKAKKISVDDPHVAMKGGLLTLSGATKYSFMKVKFWATGALQVYKEREIWFHPRKIKINGLTMPRAFVGSLVKRINPVLNLKKFPFQINLKTISVEKGVMRISSREE